jgi:hypothetical protein
VAAGAPARGRLARDARLVRCSFEGDRLMSQGGINAAGLFVLGAFLSGIGGAQTGAIDPVARKDIDAGNQAWVTGMKEGRAAPIAATYAGNALDCAASG